MKNKKRMRSIIFWILLIVAMIIIVYVFVIRTVGVIVEARESYINIGWILIVIFLVMTVRELSYRKKAEEKIRTIAITDPLTGLKNRHFFNEVIRLEVARSERYNQAISLVMLDLDRFKHINDMHGRMIGDQVLIQTGRTIQNLIRQSDILVRLDGGEFMLLLPETDINGAYEISERIRKTIEGSEYETVGRVTASLGVAAKIKGETEDDLYKSAEDAIYLAKARGRNNVVIYNKLDSLPAATIHIEWDRRLESGEKCIDEQHRELIEMANALIFISFSNVKFESVAKQLDLFLEYITVHLHYEEETLEEIGYPDYIAHMKLHRELKERALGLKDAYRRGSLKSSEFFAFILDDIIGHMQIEDVKYFPYFNAKKK